MAYRIELTSKAEKEFGALPADMRRQIATAIDTLLHFSSRAAQIKKLKTPFPEYRLRTGDYRILFTVSRGL